MSRSLMRVIFSAAVLLAFTVSQAQAATAAKEFVEKAAISGMFEIQSSELALKRTKNASVRDFAQEMVKDHHSADQKLKSIAKKEGLAVPSEMDQAHKDKLTKLREANEDFDPSYVSVQVAAHKQAVALFQSYAANGDNAALKKFAAETLPVLKDHLEDAMALSKGKKTTK